ncbi:hypothetical protein ACN6AT_37400 (plasmid) [Streptomyces sp. JL4002]|uniref:hypothetical protein n=1 Tax=Streptomyces sp. JL4002 TaxID=3404781 RepID=UPI003B27CCA6
MGVHHEASVARLLADTGYGAESIRDALDRGGWELCSRDCGYAGAPTSITNNIRKHHKKEA